MTSSVQNLEEAANIASEFIYSIDNLPHEVSHLLQEIKVKETRAQELQQEIDKDAAKYIRHSIRATTSAPSSPSSRTPSPKCNALPSKIEASYAEINELSTEKCILAQTLIDLVTRTRARLDSDLAKVRILQGEAIDYASALGSSFSAVLPGSGGIADAYGAAARNPALQVSEGLRSTLTSTSSISDIRQASISAIGSPMTPGSAGSGVQKKRRLAASSLKLTSASPTKHRSASPTTTVPLVSSHQRVGSRLSRQSITRHDTDIDEGDDDAEGEDGEGEDERLYCFCQKQSYGDMIACDNEGGCPFEWFHLSCVGMKQPTPEKWYCSVCTQSMSTKKGAAPSAGRKGRKK